ncbi:MAG: helix-turn-helix transcriptional regulator [Clostridia bacterium]|nr:helix-turn-helix transcriptional regulator [Clostridia bacterium]MDD3093081.1 helix-turn-helix transcriptional regulator [Clostridia bacterium]MDD3971150.1 helix-turn-helix transcriptional regulator [Clostridia bacterium]MDD4542990.1 helix-turn-helix transcriptional regulator [Clostridia bacterium]NLF36686.1 helix-turn-helix transcriptional regulator [Clostridiaceae bacterium]
MDSLYKKYGRRVREKRVKINMSQETLAEKCQVSTSYIGLVERGERKPSLLVLVRIANALNVSTDSLLFDSLRHIASSNKDRIMMMVNDFDDPQIDTTFEIVNQIHSYLKKDVPKIDRVDIDQILND